MSTYELLLFGHLLAAMVWVGGGVMVQMFYLRARGAGGEALGHFARTVEWIGLRVTTPASLLVIVFGVLLVIEIDGYDFGQFWITAALAMFAVSFVTGAGFLGPETGRVGKLMDERPADDPEIARRIARLVFVSRIELTLLILIVLDMVLKPGL
ncbi:MAG: DUF2269 domain-containing protein [Actinomycetota bacterium]|nr:DUF2269 domain-containing protein [Actinomycetota bacterium]